MTFGIFAFVQNMLGFFFKEIKEENLGSWLCNFISLWISRRDFISSQMKLMHTKPGVLGTDISAVFRVVRLCTYVYACALPLWIFSPCVMWKQKAQPVFNLPTGKNKKRLRVNSQALPSSVLSLPFILFSLGLSMWNKLLTAALLCLRVLARRLSGTPQFSAWFVVLSSVRLAWCPTARHVQLPLHSLSFGFWQHLVFSSAFALHFPPLASRRPAVYVSSLAATRVFI